MFVRKVSPVQVNQLAEILQKLQCASQMPESLPLSKVNRSAIAHKTATSKSVSRTIPAPHFSVSEASNGLESQEPFLLKDAMTCLSGQKVLDFMPRLMTACGRDVVNYEVQGRGKAQSLAAPFAQYIQLLQRSESGEAYFMMSDKLLRPELSDLLSIPEGLSTGRSFFQKPTCHPSSPNVPFRQCLAIAESPSGEEFQLPTLALSGKRWLQVGGKGARTRLRPDRKYDMKWCGV